MHVVCCVALHDVVYEIHRKQNVKTMVKLEGDQHDIEVDHEKEHPDLHLLPVPIRFPIPVHDIEGHKEDPEPLDDDDGASPYHEYEP